MSWIKIDGPKFINLKAVNMVRAMNTQTADGRHKSYEVWFHFKGDDYEDKKEKEVFSNSKARDVFLKMVEGHLDFCNA